MKGYDAIVVGAGFSGAVMAERMASQLGYKVLLLEQRDHIGGNCHDQYDSAGNLIHTYGPHIFHTRHREVWDYLSQFTEWRSYEHRVLGEVDGQLIPIPFNLTSLRICFDEHKAGRLKQKLIQEYGAEARVPILELRKHCDPELVELADFIYQKVFVNYTSKQWGCRPEDISPTVTARVPVILSDDDRYFQDPYQGLPINGYTVLFRQLLDHPAITVCLSTPFKNRVRINGRTLVLDGKHFDGVLIYTGMLDELFDYAHGELPYRSLRFDFENIKREFYQPVGTINYPNDPYLTRVTEFKHLTGQASNTTSIVKEYPQAYDRENDMTNVPYYPVVSEFNNRRYRVYEVLAQSIDQLIYLGRLAEYRYINMDEAVMSALNAFTKLTKVQERLERD